MFNKVHLREPVNGWTHLIGAFLSLIGLIALVGFAAADGKLWHIVAFGIFGLSMILLYTASALYHSLSLSDAGMRRMRRFDHMMIYVLIAGTYTPLCLIPLRDSIWGWGMFVVIWTLAIAGIIIKAKWLHAPRWFTVMLYLAMGWMGVSAAPALLERVPFNGLVWLLIGGLFYSVGAIIYALKRPNFVPGVFGHHEIWHLFVMAGTGSHFWLMMRHILPLS